MKKKILYLTLLSFSVLSLTGCNELKEGVRDLPDKPSNESSHNSFDDKQNYLSEQQPATLDEGYIDQYIDVDSFDKNATEVDNNADNASANFERENNNINSNISKTKQNYNDQASSMDTDVSDTKEKASSNYQKSVDEAEKSKKEKEEEYNTFSDKYKTTEDEK